MGKPKPFTPKAAKSIRKAIRGSLIARAAGNETSSQAQMDQAIAEAKDPASRQR